MIHKRKAGLVFWVVVFGAWLLFMQLSWGTELVLSTPKAKPYYAEKVRVQWIFWDFEVPKIDIRFQLGYVDDMGNWVKTSEEQLTLEDKSATGDQPAKTDYSDMVKALKTLTWNDHKGFQKALLKLLKKKYEGTIQ
jgi:hypothetical protein